MLFGDEVIRGGPGQAKHGLLAIGAYGHYHDATCLQLALERSRDLRCTTGDNDAIERCVGDKSLVPIPKKEGGPVVECAQSVLGGLVQGLLPFDAEQFGPHLTQHGRLIATASSDLEHLLPFREPEQLGLHGYSIWLGDGLPLPNRERLVQVCKREESTIVDEEVARHRANGGQDTLIRDPLALDLFHQSLAQALVPVVVF